MWSATDRTAVLELDAKRAGLAWACPFSTSAEFEAAVIQSRRRAGAYGRRRMAMLGMTAVSAVALATSLLLI